MRVPARLHITWEDDQTPKMETDAGTQTRFFYFGASQGEGANWQGVSKASWEFDAGFGLPAERFDRGFGTQVRPSGGALKVVTTRLKPGYLRKNGIPYSADAVVTEYYDRVTESNGVVYLVITTTVEDHQCVGYVAPYVFSAPGYFRIWEERDPQTQELIAIKMRPYAAMPDRTIWMDGRPHPPAYAQHTWAGFSTGKYEGNILTVYTTHIT